MQNKNNEYNLTANKYEKLMNKENKYRTGTVSTLRLFADFAGITDDPFPS